MAVADSTPALSAQAKGKGVSKEKEANGELESTRSKRTGGAGTSVDSTGLGLNGGGILISRPLSEQIPRMKSDTAPPAPARMTNEYPAWALPDNIQPIRLPVDFKGGNVKIGEPIIDSEAAASMSPINYERARPIPVEPMATKRLSTGDHKMLPRRLAEDIQQFQVSDFARRYFSTHKTGLIFRRRVPVEQLMVWQKVCRFQLLYLNSFSFSFIYGTVASPYVPPSYPQSIPSQRRGVDLQSHSTHHG